VSVSLSLTLSKNEKVEQHIRNKTRKPNTLRFWVEGGIIPLYGFWLSSHCLKSPSCFSPRIFPASGKWYQSQWFAAHTSTVKGRMLPLEGECINVEEGLSLEGEIVRYPNVSLSPTLSKNEKVEQHIRKKTCNVLD